MSKYRENATWQDKDGRWCMGFFTVIEPPVEDQDEEWDEEWDVDYDYDTFEFATVGHLTEQAAWDAGTADRANPGQTTVYRLADQAEQCAQFDTMAAACIQAEAARQAEFEALMADYNRSH